jgi:hypothetical protein
MLTARHLNSGQRHGGGNDVLRWNAGQKDSNFFRPPPMARLKPLPYPPPMIVGRPSVPAVEGGASTLWPSLVVMAFCLLLVLLALWMG